MDVMPRLMKRLWDGVGKAQKVGGHGHGHGHACSQDRMRRNVKRYSPATAKDESATNLNPNPDSKCGPGP